MKLSKRELDCVTLLIEGKTLNEAATKLNITSCTAKHYLKNIRLKLNSKNMAQTIYKVMKLNLLKRED